MDGKIPIKREGLDYFYNSATGKNESCSDKCDIPSLYEYTCSRKCKFYIPKPRVTIEPSKRIEEYIQDTQYSIYICLGIGFVLCLVTIALGFIFRKKLRQLLTNLKERLCERLSIAQIETGETSTNAPLAQAKDTVGQRQNGYQLVTQDDSRTATTNMGSITGEDSNVNIVI